MNNTITIFCEGKTDIKFIKDIIQHRYKIIMKKEDFINLGGWTNIKNVKNNLNISTQKGKTNIVILDADDDFAKRDQQIQDIRKSLGVNFEFFLFPNNHDNGDIEVLFQQIINSKHSSVLSCFHNYEACLKKANPSYFSPTRKAKIYAYIEAIIGTKEMKKKEIYPEKRNYQNKEIWDLNNSALSSLYSFLDKFLN